MRKFTLLGAVALATLPTMGQAQTILNSDFSLGNTGFTSSYTYTTDPNGLLNDGSNAGAGYYAIGNNPNYYHPSWTGAPFAENAMIVNATNVANTPVWTGSLDPSGTQLVVGNQYTFSVNIANIYPASPATLVLSIGGDPTDYSSQVITAGAGANNVFVKQSVTFTAMSSSPSFTLTDTNLQLGGNDFAISNMEVQSVPEPMSLSLIGLGVGALLRRRKA